jgi:4-hydroxy-tetrahydrodipicolinate reductase
LVPLDAWARRSAVPSPPRTTSSWWPPWTSPPPASALRDHTGVDTELTIAGDLDGLTDAGCEVAVEFTGPSSVGANLRWLLEHRIHAVVGATGIDAADLEAARVLAADGEANALVAPNFAIGAVLLMRFAAEAAKHLPHVEIIELHHDRKVDAPRGRRCGPRS